MTKRFKYQEYLDKYKNCPMQDCAEQDLIAYRWVHQPITEDDFRPILADPNQANKIIDGDDRMCTGYALSLFKDANAAITEYRKTYERFDRPSKRTRFKEGKGTFSAKISITKNDGVSDMPKSNGHFHFFEYDVDSNLVDTVSEILDNFV